MTLLAPILMLAIMIPRLPLAQSQPEVPPLPLRPLDMAPFSAAVSTLSDQRIAELDSLVLEASVAQLQAAMQAGDLDAVSLVTYYLYRIREYDQNGLNAVMELNPNVLTDAARLDEERDAGVLRGPLHGIPVLVKDNISTAGPMHTSAGAAIFMDNVSSHDAFIVTQLLQAGAIILGKGNLSEFANWVSPELPNGFSVVGGQTLSPYDPEMDPSGSSTGPAVAVSANLVALSVGTETSASIISPAGRNGIVGMYPSRGLLSRDGIVPLAESQDTAGPMARNVADAAVLLTALKGVDPSDAVTRAAASLANTDFTTFLDVDALQGRRIGLLGILPVFLENDALLAQLGWDVVLEGMERAGPELVILEPGNAPRFPLQALLVPSFQRDMSEFLNAHFAGSDVTSVADIVRFNTENPAIYQPYGQQYLEASAQSTVTSEDYRTGVQHLRSAAAAYLDGLLIENDVDAIVSIGSNLSGIYPTAGYPAVTVPGGVNSEGIPFGVTFVGPYLADGGVLGMAYAFEQVTIARVIPPVGFGR